MNTNFADLRIVRLAHRLGEGGPSLAISKQNTSFIPLKGSVTKAAQRSMLRHSFQNRLRSSMRRRFPDAN